MVEKVKAEQVLTVLLHFFQVSGLNSGRGLKIKIFAVNANGKSESAVLEGFTLKVAQLQIGKFVSKSLIILS